MPDIEWNKNTWDGWYDWKQSGDEWSAPWGSSPAMWFTSIMPRIAFVLPAKSVLEIAPGHGRCTSFLLRFADSYHGIDLSERCIRYCEERFAAQSRAKFHRNDGHTLTALADGDFDLVFSFDSLVHADLDVIVTYVPQIIKKLRKGGVAFIHHSNLAEFPGVEWQHRSTEVSAEKVEALIESHGGRTLIQEVFGGDGKVVIPDCFSLFCRRDDYLGFDPIKLRTPNLFTIEGAIGRGQFQPYMALDAARRG